MTPETGRRMLLITFILALAIVTYQEVHDAKLIPRPRRYIGAGVVYGILGVLAPFISYPLAGWFGAGMVLTLVYQHYQSVKPTTDGDSDVQVESI